MANLSEWLGVASAQTSTAPRVQPGWLALLEEPTAFREAMPFGMAEMEPELAAAPEPALPDPAEDAFARAYAEGLAAGRAMAEAEADAAATRQRALRLALRALDEVAQGVLADDLAATVIALCDGALAGCALDRDALLARCHAAAQRIGGAAENLTLHCHPDDLALLDAAALGGWQVAADSTLERGTVLVEGPDGAVSDGPAEWRRAIAAAVRG
ncbi:MAG TPA: FliH/SctL family protein [Erythrobacter sp.]|nr:FliH/SctL family protein [Erythrobacter sp.]